MSRYTRFKNQTAAPQSNPTKLNVVAYYDFKRTFIDDGFAACELIRRAGATTKFDKMIALGSEIILKNLWKQAGIGLDNFMLSARDSKSGSAIQIPLSSDEYRPFATGLINYTNHRFILLSARDSFEIFVYEDRTDLEMLAFWGFLSKKVNKGPRNKDIERQMLTLIENATPIEQIA